MTDKEKFYIYTFGCQMNKHDSERLAGLLTARGYKEAFSPQDAHIHIFNTCSIRRHAEERFFGVLSGLKSRKKREAIVVAVGGCTAQKEKEKLLERVPWVDIVFGTFDLAKLPELIVKAKSGYTVVSTSTEFETLPTNLPLKRKNQKQAWLSISIGCNNFCTYCIVPYVRGPEISRSFEEIVEEAKRLAFDGVVEITLLGQNVNSYGRDLYGRPRFAQLLTSVNEIRGLKRIRFTTSHPKDLNLEVIEAIKEAEKVCEHIHLPLQAGSTKILKAMGRGYTKEDYLNLVCQIRQVIPDVSITTDIMVGFPGETEKDFNDTLDVVEKAHFDQAFTFIFSPREGTPAAQLKDKTTNGQKLIWFKRLVELQRNISLSSNQKLVGQVVEVFVEGLSKKDSAFLTGRTTTNKIVNFSGPSNLIHQFVKVIVTKAYPFHLIGEVSSYNHAVIS